MKEVFKIVAGVYLAGVFLFVTYVAFYFALFSLYR